MAADIISSTTQQFLDIHDITNNFVIMKDGTVSIILTVDAMNFGLLAEEEQDAVMYAYAGLLNSLNYPIQVVINSQTKDVTSYLSLLKDQEADASNETIRKRIRQYREFVSNLIHDRNVLDKKFYVVIAANSIELGFAGAKSVLPGHSKFDITSIERSLLLEKAQNILEPRRDHLIAQFARIGLFSRQLTTQEIIQLFYIRYNPEAAEGQHIAESSSYASPLVEASIQGSPMNIDPTTSAVSGMSPVSPQPAANLPNTAPSPMPMSPTPDMPTTPGSTPLVPTEPTSPMTASTTSIETPTEIPVPAPPTLAEMPADPTISTPTPMAASTDTIANTTDDPVAIQKNLNSVVQQMGVSAPPNTLNTPPISSPTSPPVSADPTISADSPTTSSVPTTETSTQVPTSEQANMDTQPMLPEIPEI
ncbi:MAG: hypothetical protein COY81_02450 [Candidatus Pacebacteria bacterium CG_4_10_14_0_8_um_filter_43_12]|nr:MAG: hypothetical protein COU66_02940 [Candidatus Pacebacteria bacterium CG10_big_fil_rev_8_21_14_0_10_44_11]PIY79464.1 MAG: hypothetical protein COY81_02450 [Candidatus Pacebacteria bacterium CG_4_10_14_0_8_um_filter_43_12]